LSNTTARFANLALLCFAATCIAQANTEITAQIDTALTRAADYLADAQSPDGRWRSETYGCFKEGFALTPYVMSCLPFIPCRRERLDEAFDRGVDALLNAVDEHGNIDTGPRPLGFPVYTAASAARVVALVDKSERNLAAQQAWLGFLRGHQLGRNLGWAPDDDAFGGWGFAVYAPKRPEDPSVLDPFAKSNLAATVFAAAAMKSARVPSNDAIWSDILIFVTRCQNFPDHPDAADARFDDGGFFFAPGDGVGNKAGIAGTDRFGRTRYRSYGSMTGDGLRALLCCGLDADHPRVVAARLWLEQNFSTETNPGEFAEDRRVLQNATYYYYLWAVAHAFTRLGIDEINGPHGRIRWAEVLAEQVIKLQRPDGTWANRYTDAKEDDPLVATPWAAAVLANCRYVITTANLRGEDACPKIPRGPGSGTENN